jgi:hypothetical protein
MLRRQRLGDGSWYAAMGCFLRSFLLRSTQRAGHY